MPRQYSRCYVPSTRSSTSRSFADGSRTFGRQRPLIRVLVLLRQLPIDNELVGSSRADVCCRAHFVSAFLVYYAVAVAIRYGDHKIVTTFGSETPDAALARIERKKSWN
jgi:hypothetical protein